MRAVLTILIAAVLALGSARAAPAERDLGLGLKYFRARAIPADLPTSEAARGGPVVLDLRYAAGDSAGALALTGWLKFHAGPKSPVFLLANAATSRRLLAPLASPDAVRGLIILGAAAPSFEPDISLAVTAEADRKCWEAFERGTPLEALLSDRREKPRDDEALLVREHLSDSALSADPVDPSSAPPAQAAPLLDEVLRRAVQLHRTLVALRRLPAPAGTPAKL